MANPVPDDPKNPAGKPQGTLRDQELTMEAEGQPAHDGEPVGGPTVNADELPDDESDEERERKAKLVRDGSGF